MKIVLSKARNCELLTSLLFKPGKLTTYVLFFPPYSFYEIKNKFSPWPVHISMWSSSQRSIVGPFCKLFHLHKIIRKGGIGQHRNLDRQPALIHWHVHEHTDTHNYTVTNYNIENLIRSAELVICMSYFLNFQLFLKKQFTILLNFEIC